jgi:phospholipid/cholesterol/gamma-HCH transport system substrate-binding protein
VIPTRPRRTLLAIVAALVALPGLSACTGGGYKLVAEFDDAGDLQSRGGVQIADVRVGTISSVTLTDHFKARVTMRLNRGVKVPTNSQALLRTTSLLGEKFIELRPNGDPTKGPFLADGDMVASSGEAPELEIVTQQAIEVLSAVTSNDVASIVDTGASAFGDRGDELRSLVTDLGSISHTLAARTTEITTIIQHLDGATATLAASKDDLSALFVNLSQATTVLADNRQRMINALDQLSRLARSQNVVLDRYRSDVDRQIKQVDTVLAAAAASSAEVANLLDWLNRFTTGVPKVVRNDFTQIFQWVTTAAEDPRANTP